MAGSAVGWGTPLSKRFEYPSPSFVFLELLLPVLLGLFSYLYFGCCMSIYQVNK